MENETAQDHCYCAEYLKNRIKEFEYEGIPTELEEKLLLYVENMDMYMSEYVADPTYETGDDLLDTFIRYCADTIPYTDGTDTIEKFTCHGEYDHVTSLTRESGRYETYNDIYAILETRPTPVETTDPTTGAVTTTIANEHAEENTQEIFNYISYDIPKDFALYEFIQSVYKGEKDRLYLYEEVVTLADRLVKSNVERYVYLPKLKKLDISYNADLGGIDRISELTSLRELYANANYLGNIQNVDWSALKYLRKLGLAYNYITDITCLEVLNHIVDLDVSHNLLAGEFNFNFAKSQNTLKNFDLSYNQLSDITRIQEFLDLITYGNYANYLALEDTLNINLSNQNLVIEVEEPINLKQFPSTVNIELPKIFTQLLAIDTNRTSFGITSEDGRIESEGTFVTVSTLTEGDKVAKANVIAQSGNGTPVETCVGEGTTISEDGKLTIAADETAETITIEARSKDDGSVVTTVTVSTVELPPEDPENPGTDPEVDVIDTDTLGYEAGEEFLTNVKAKTSIEDFERVLLNGKEYNVVVKKEDKDGNKSVVTEGYVGTGMYVQVQDENGNVIKDEDGHLVVYEIVVKGDVNGDGLANSVDSILIKAYRNEVASISGTAKAAADINNDGKVSVADSKLLLYHRAEVTGYDLNYKK